MVDINKTIRENLGLVYSQLAKFDLLEDQDAESLAYEALHKAICTFKGSKNAKLSTYACCVISNALRGHLRSKNKKRQIQHVSYYEPLNSDGPDDIYLVDTLCSGMSADAGIYTKEFYATLTKALSKIYKDITSPVQRKIFVLWVNSGFKIKQAELVSETGVSQAAVSRTLSSFRYSLSKELEEYL